MSPTPSSDATPSTSDATPSTAGAERKKSLYRRFKDARSAPFNKITDEDLKKYTGMTKAELGEWSKDRPGVGGNKCAGDITNGPASGLGGSAAAGGFGGWGPGARGDLKFPPQKKQAKTLDNETEDE